MPKIDVARLTDEYDEDFEEERAIEYRAILDEEDKLLHHSSWKRNAKSIDRTSFPSIDTDITCIRTPINLMCTLPQSNGMSM